MQGFFYVFGDYLLQDFQAYSAISLENDLQYWELIVSVIGIILEFTCLRNLINSIT